MGIEAACFALEGVHKPLLRCAMRLNGRRFKQVRTLKNGVHIPRPRDSDAYTQAGGVIARVKNVDERRGEPTHKRFSMMKFLTKL